MCIHFAFEMSPKCFIHEKKMLFIRVIEKKTHLKEFNFKNVYVLYIQSVSIEILNDRIREEILII